MIVLDYLHYLVRVKSLVYNEEMDALCYNNESLMTQIDSINRSQKSMLSI